MIILHIILIIIYYIIFLKNLVIYLLLRKIYYINATAVTIHNCIINQHLLITKKNILTNNFPEFFFNQIKFFFILPTKYYTNF